MNRFPYKNVLVIGYARSGKAAIKLLKKFNVEKITLCEAKDIEEIDELKKLAIIVRKQDEEVFKDDYDLVIKNPGISPLKDFIIDFQKRNIPIITEVELAYELAKPQHYLAITGTNGKTTTTTLVYEILKKAYANKAYLAGNIGIPLADIVLDNDLINSEGNYIALELSQGQLGDLKDFHPEVSTIVNLSPDHIDFMGSLDAYYDVKTRIYKNCDDNDAFLLNMDDDNIIAYTNKHPIKAKIKTFSLYRHDTDAHIEDNWIVIENEKLIDINKVRIPGMHNIQNIMIASYMCKIAGVKSEDIQEVIYNFKGVKHRIEFVREVDGVKYYNDSKATNTDATITALKAFEKNVILLVGGFEKGLSMDEVKKYLGPVKEVIGYGLAGERIATDLIGDKAHIVKDLKEAIALSKEIAKEGDIVLLSPTTSSFDQYRDFEERGDHFIELVNEL